MIKRQQREPGLNIRVRGFGVGDMVEVDLNIFISALPELGMVM